MYSFCPILAPTDFEAIIKADHFKSRQKPVQQLFTPDSRPYVVQEVYDESDPPPSLQKFNEFHPPKTDCMDRYSKPRYFFELWASGELQKQMARKQNRRGRVRDLYQLFAERWIVQLAVGNACVGLW